MPLAVTLQREKKTVLDSERNEEKKRKNREKVFIIIVFPYLEVVVAYGTVRCSQVIVHTLPKVLQTGGIGRGAGLRARRTLQQQTAGAGRVLAGALALFILQRCRPTDEEILIIAKNNKNNVALRGWRGGSPGRADCRGVGLAVLLGALWLAALCIQLFNHCTDLKKLRMRVPHCGVRL